MSARSSVVAQVFAGQLIELIGRTCSFEESCECLQIEAIGLDRVVAEFALVGAMLEVIVDGLL